MSATLTPMSLDLVLPWSVNAEQDEKFTRTIKRLLAVLLVLFIVVPFLPTWDVKFGQIEQKPVVRTKVIIEPPAMPEISKPVQEVAPVQKPVPAAQKPVPQKVTEQPAAAPKAGNDAPRQEFAALSSQLSSLRNKVDISKLQNKNLSEKGGQAQANERASLGKESLTKTSGGLNNSDMDVEVKGAALAKYQGSTVSSPIAAMELPDEGKGYSEGSRGRRDMESIRRTIENAKGPVYALYAKALRQYPELSGKFVFELVVEPDGSISRLKLTRSDLGVKDLEEKMLAKLAAINFGKDSVSPTAVQYTFVFIPS